MHLTPLNVGIGLALAIALIGWWPLPALVLLLGYLVYRGGLAIVRDEGGLHYAQ